jgi:hypothetical protein
MKHKVEIIAFLRQAKSAPRRAAASISPVSRDPPLGV